MSNLSSTALKTHKTTETEKKEHISEFPTNRAECYKYGGAILKWWGEKLPQGNSLQLQLKQTVNK